MNMDKTTNTPAISVTSEFTAPRGAYAIVGNSNNLEDQMNMRISQLRAMMEVTYGEPGEAFRRMNAEIQDNYLWACTTMVAEIAQLAAVRVEYGDDASFVFAQQSAGQAYRDGCGDGHQSASNWLANPQRGDPQAGGTLQHVMLALAERMRTADTAEEVERIRGEIVGFCYRVECPQDAILCERSDAARQYETAH
jgi:hypothetical protein